MQDRYLRTGIFLAPFHALHENPTLAIERDMELVEHLDRLNYHEAWIGEHHSGGFEIIACPEMFLAAAAQRTRNIRLGTGVVSLPYHHPFTLASRMMQLDHMARGRAMFGVGPGALIYDADKIGLKAADQRRRMNESLDCIMPLMRGETITQKTDWFTLNEARLQLMPYSQPGMEMAVACSRSPVGAVASGKHGIGMLSIGGTSDDALKAHANNWAIHEEDAAKAGKKSAGRHGLWPEGFLQVLHRRCDLPDHPARRHRSGRVPDQQRRRLHRHAGRLHKALRAAVAGLERRLRRRAAALAQLGRLGIDQAQLRADGALCPSALPAPVQQPARGEL
jgi:alkanesulfonate monooxygenase SsuD/methylene tetrahydromethanopterin reductase-like flavin-dependent oxidoreductase (luciferase family)